MSSCQSSVRKPSVFPISLRIKAEVPTRWPLWAYLLSLLTLPHPRWPSWSSTVPRILIPQGLCICYSLCLKTDSLCCSLTFSMSLLIVTFMWGLLWLSYWKSNTVPISHLVLSSLFLYFISLRSMYGHGAYFIFYLLFFSTRTWARWVFYSLLHHQLASLCLVL